MPRYFTLQQAQSQLLIAAEHFREALRAKSEYDAAEQELEASLKHITLMGGTLVDQDRFADQRKRRETGARHLQAALDRIQSLGCLVKDLDVGLLDFPTLYRGEEVFLCWKLGEPRIGYWHGVAEGFRGRKEIDQEFLDNHQGDPLN